MTTHIPVPPSLPGVKAPNPPESPATLNDITNAVRYENAVVHAMIAMDNAQTNTDNIRDARIYQHRVISNYLTGHIEEGFSDLLRTIQKDMKTMKDSICKMDRNSQEGTKEIKQKLDGVDKRLDGMDKRLDGVDKRLDSMDKRLDALEKQSSVADKRFDLLGKQLGVIEEHLIEAAITSAQTYNWSCFNGSARNFKAVILPNGDKPEKHNLPYLRTVEDIKALDLEDAKRYYDVYNLPRTTRSKTLREYQKAVAVYIGCKVEIE